jgi:hypothetical protein
MKFRCIVCQTTWGEGIPEVEGYSDGLCEAHAMILLVKLYREKQASEKNPDCCGKSDGYCDQDLCRFRHVCLSPNRPPAEVINLAIAELSARAEAQRIEKENLYRELHGEDHFVANYIH